jgi:hypothetical protein
MGLSKYEAIAFNNRTAIFAACEHSYAYMSKIRNEQFMCTNNTVRLAQIQCKVTCPTGRYLMLPTIFCKTREYIITVMQWPVTEPLLWYHFYAVALLCCHVMWGPCHHSTARHRVGDAGTASSYEG